jgi:hypothetical protein
MANRLRVTELDFDTIKQNLKNFLKQQNEFTDYDFEGSGLSVLLDILAYNTHYNAYYLNMIANESFLDTALLRDSVVSHAKTLGYVPSSAQAPVAKINFTIESGVTTSSTCTLPEGFSFLSNQIDGAPYNFIVLNETTVSKTNTQFVFDNLEIYEGQLVTYSFSYDQSANPKQIFVLPDINIDASTVKVRVTPNNSNTSSTVYTKVTDVLEILPTSEVFFLQEGRTGRYEIYFGNDVIGKSLPDGCVVTVTYLSTNGDVANKANNFVSTSLISDSLGNSLSNFTITPILEASGGNPRESVDSIKFSSVARFSTQNRLVTYKDYETYIFNNYPNVESISVWGGEDEIPPVFGKVFISLKTRENYYLSEREKQRILDDVITPKSITVITPELIDPDFTYVLLETSVEYDPKKTTLSETSLEQAIRSSIINYNNTYLNKFDSKLIISRLQDSIDNTDLNSIVGCKTTVKLQKRITPSLGIATTYSVPFNVKLFRGSINNRLTSSEFNIIDATGITRTVSIEEIPDSATGISSIKMVSGGSGYLSPPTVTITGDGFGATARAIVENGSVTSVIVTNQGINYTKAVVTFSGGGARQSATASVIINSNIGTLRVIYYDINAERQVIFDNIGTIDYDSGLITIRDLNIVSALTDDGLVRFTAQTTESIIKSVRNTIISIDTTDPTSIVTDLIKS